MIKNLDRHRDKLADLGGGLGVADPVSLATSSPKPVGQHRPCEPGKGAVPVSESTQLGRRSVAPSALHLVHLARCRRMSLLASSPQRAIGPASFIGAR
jgi:hypothetical protein